MKTVNKQFSSPQLKLNLDLRKEVRKTPYLTINLNKINEQFKTFISCLPDVACYYSVKSNPSAEIMCMLLSSGAKFEAASIGEIIKCINLGVSPENIHYGNSVKANESIKDAAGIGVNSFAFDSQEELDKLVAVKNANTRVICRLATDGKGATWGLCNKFGCSTETAVELCEKAHRLGFKRIGLSFHVGSQQNDPSAWERALENTAKVIDTLSKKGITICTVNIGGGFPASGYMDAEHNLVNFDYHAYLGKVNQYIQQFKSQYNVDFMAEPGRFLLSESGEIVSTVILATNRIINEQSKQWLYLDIGKFNGLYEGSDITHQIKCKQPTGVELVKTIVTGPTCDSDDMLMCGDKPYMMPETIQTGDTVKIKCVGAYSTSYTSVEFNGFQPIKVYFKNRKLNE